MSSVAVLTGGLFERATALIALTALASVLAALATPLLFCLQVLLVAFPLTHNLFRSPTLEAPLRIKVRRHALCTERVANLERNVFLGDGHDLLVKGPIYPARMAS